MSEHTPKLLAKKNMKTNGICWKKESLAEIQPMDSFVLNDKSQPITLLCGQAAQTCDWDYMENADWVQILFICEKSLFWLEACSKIHIPTYHTYYLPFIMDTSLAPSPMARVTAFFVLLISSTTMAFCSGVTRQQITALHCEAMSRNLKTDSFYLRYCEKFRQ